MARMLNLAALTLIACLPAAAQAIISSYTNSTAAGRGGTVRISAPASILELIAGKPFSAEEHQQTIQTRPDGTRVEFVRPVRKLYRDSKGPHTA